jgi:hypothetical protein
MSSPASAIPATIPATRAVSEPAASTLVRAADSRSEANKVLGAHRSEADHGRQNLPTRPSTISSPRALTEQRPAALAERNLRDVV